MARLSGMDLSFTLNGKSVHVPDAAPARLAIDLLRDHFGLTGANVGCDTSQCGACNILLDGRAVKSCTLLSAQLHGHEIVTIEGLATGDHLHPMQAAFRDAHGLQCGFCTPGMVIAGLDIARRHGPHVSPQDIARDLSGNICRCTGYLHIIAAIAAGARAMTPDQEAQASPIAQPPA